MTIETPSLPWPIGIRLFNRPDYAKRLLESLASQTFNIDGGLVFCFIDGFNGSKAQKSNEPDHTKEVAQLVRQFFPNATIVQSPTNVGLAHALFELQSLVFTSTEAQWGLFFEDDLVLDSMYLEQLCHLIEISAPFSQIAKLGVFQLRTGYIKHPPKSDRKDIFLGEGTKAFAERHSYFLKRQVLTEVYLDALAGKQYSERDHVKIYSEMAMHGVFAFTTYNDAIQDRILAHFNELHVVTSKNFATDIGVSGENNLRHPSVKLNFSSPEALLRYTSSDIADLLPEFELERTQLERALFNDFYKQFMAVSRGRYALQFVVTRGFEKLQAIARQLFRK